MIHIFDGAMGTMLQSAGMKPGENSELQSLAHPEWVESIHRSYLEAGSRVIYANTFGANRRKLAKSGHTPDEIIRASIEIAKRVAEPFDAAVALDVEALKDMEKARSIFLANADAGIGDGSPQAQGACTALAADVQCDGA